ncbi:MAG: hypothetical protein VX438_19630, partial [Planctomycetota bacterium]|nr:hypothetical protein [Planctomycetota bacterium]
MLRMTDESFDPYSSWLGLKTSNRPPNHYELLDLENFESNKSTLLNAIEKQASILQMVSGEKAGFARKLLKDLGQVRDCLLDEQQKAEYDKELRREFSVNGLPTIVTEDSTSGMPKT